ncbi:hypothetical protein [Paenibacillus radicis (ex Gao et al. 2016)]|uniref:RiboL-PSP-HEPN domain-containing protein n=1 Tax=Paenibacillus radicis (ex Gao et al. 2016) TaxID=1737354 RepID=A0A917M770_9BACL|nr:hypothetical protein [Paenibacillus radicis (ex Gao et al. 2016)]GGG82120.1 hypothetical protein GCM10010918_44330 [Paenibacillus radicis (ex Gao et al. 2016)]
MENNFEETPIQELPIRRFYFSVTLMLSQMQHNKRGQELFSGLYTCINSYHDESLALLRATTKLFKTSLEQEQKFKTSYLKERSEIDKLLIDEDDEEKKEHLKIIVSRNLEAKRHFYENLDLEQNVFSLGTIVQFLSSFESTLHSFYKKIIEIDTHLPKIEDVCKRDKGIIKYLKYFEKALTTNPNSVLIGTPDFQKVHQWIDFRNNIVHNNNLSTEELKNVINQRKLSIRYRRGKFIFNESNIRDIADICGVTLDKLVEEVLRPYFKQSGALVE